PSSVCSGVATATSVVVNRSWQAEGSCKEGASAGRGFGRGTTCAAALLTTAKPKISGKRMFTPAFYDRDWHRQEIDCAARTGWTQVKIEKAQPSSLRIAQTGGTARDREQDGPIGAEPGPEISSAFAHDGRA